MVDGTAHQALHRCPKACPSLLYFCCVNHCNPGFLLEKTAEICMKNCRLFWGHQAYPGLCRWIICINFSKYLWINNQTCVKALRRPCYILCFFFLILVWKIQNSLPFPFGSQIIRVLMKLAKWWHIENSMKCCSGAADIQIKTITCDV